MYSCRKKSLKTSMNPYIEEEQITQWQMKKIQKDKQRSTKHTYKTKDLVTRIPLKTEGELRCSERLSSSCSTSDTRRVRFIYLIFVKTLIWSLWCIGCFPSCVLYVACFSGFPLLMALFVFSYVYLHALK